MSLSNSEIRVTPYGCVLPLWCSAHVASAGPEAICNRALIALIVDTDVRRVEAARLELKDVDRQDQLILVCGKDNKER